VATVLLETFFSSILPGVAWIRRHRVLLEIFRSCPSYCLIVSTSWLAGQDCSLASYRTAPQSKNESLIVPYVVTMQFLTNAPCLITRASSADCIYKEGLTFAERVGETRLAPAVLVGACWAPVLWRLNVRPEFVDLAEGYTTFWHGAPALYFSWIWRTS
jgi:hypothetical protein